MKYVGKKSTEPGWHRAHSDATWICVITINVYSTCVTLMSKHNQYCYCSAQHNGSAHEPDHIHVKSHA